MLVQKSLGVVAALAEPLIAVREERPRLGDDVVLDPEVENATRRGDALAELDVELRLAELYEQNVQQQTININASFLKTGAYFLQYFNKDEALGVKFFKK